MKPKCVCYNCGKKVRQNKYSVQEGMYSMPLCSECYHKHGERKLSKLFAADIVADNDY